MKKLILFLSTVLFVDKLYGSPNSLQLGLENGVVDTKRICADKGFCNTLVLSPDFENDADCSVTANKLKPILSKELGTVNILAFCQQNYAIFVHDAVGDLSLSAFHSDRPSPRVTERFRYMEKEENTLAFPAIEQGKVVHYEQRYNVIYERFADLKVRFEAERDCRNSLNQATDIISKGSVFGTYGTRKVLASSCVQLKQGKFGFFVIYIEPIMDPVGE